MQKRITERLRYFWDAGIRGPDFVWAAIGPRVRKLLQLQRSPTDKQASVHGDRVSHGGTAYRD